MRVALIVRLNPAEINQNFVVNIDIPLPTAMLDPPGSWELPGGFGLLLPRLVDQLQNRVDDHLRFVLLNDMARMLGKYQ